MAFCDSHVLFHKLWQVYQYAISLHEAYLYYVYKAQVSMSTKGRHKALAGPECVAGAEPYGPKLYIGKAFNGIGKARPGLGSVMAVSYGQEIVPIEEILQNLTDFERVTVNSATIRVIATSRSVPLVVWGPRNKKIFACRVQFEGWEEVPAQDRGGAVLITFGPSHGAHILPGTYVDGPFGPRYEYNGQSSRDLSFNQSSEIYAGKS